MKRPSVSGRSPLAGVAIALCLCVAALGCGKAASGTSGGAQRLSATTPAPTSDVGKITWATYREVQTLDPIQAFDYPENTAITALCDSLFRQHPDGTVGPGLAEPAEHPNATTTVIKLRDGVTFSDGRPVTANDVVFSLKRAADPASGSLYAAVFARVKSITATDSKTITIRLARPDYWLDGELSQMPGVVVEQAYAESKGREFGTPSGGIVCAGPYRVGSWKPGSELSVVRNDSYWDAARRARVAEIDFKGAADEASLTSGLITGDIDGSYPQPLGTIDQLKANDQLTVTEGPSFATDALVISNPEGALGDVRVRQALSAAIDREAYIEQVYHGMAQVPRTLANPGTWGYGRDVFQADWDKLPQLTQDLAKAKQLISAAGAEGKTITLGTTTEIQVINSATTAVRTAAEAIGLEVKLRAVPAQSYIGFFTDPGARAGLDGFPTVNYPDYADPAALYKTFALPDGIQNYSGFADPQITTLLERARSTADAEERAKLVAEAGDRIVEQLPWIPMAEPNSVLITRSDLTGAPASFVYMGGPWANLLGAR